MKSPMTSRTRSATRCPWSTTCWYISSRWGSRRTRTGARPRTVHLRQPEANRSRGPLLPIRPVHLGEEVIAGLDFVQPLFVHAGGGQLVMQRDEPEQVVFHAPAGVIGAGARPEDERPVTGLGQQQFARGLAQGPLLQAGRLRKFPRQPGHAFPGDLQMRINPLV